MDIRAWWTHQEFAQSNLPPGGWTVVVIDCLRATTSIAAALAAGCVEVRPAADEAEARRWALAEHAVLAGERDCVEPPGFDLGNSPAAFSAAAVGGRQVVLWTTNGSRALAAARQTGSEVLAVALVNVGATAAYLMRKGRRQVAIVCAGTEGAFSLEDAYAAGALADRIGSADPDTLALDERATAAWLLYRGGRADPRAVFDVSAAAAKLRHCGLGEDIAFAVREDALPVAAVWHEAGLQRG